MDNFEHFSITENDKIKEYSVLSTFKIVGSDDNFIVYTDYSLNNNKKLNIQISKFFIKNEEITLIPITDENEKKSTNEYLIELEKFII